MLIINTFILFYPPPPPYEYTRGGCYMYGLVVVMQMYIFIVLYIEEKLIL